MKNNILGLAVVVTKFIRALDVFLGFLLIFFMIAWPMGADFFENIRMVEDGSVFKFETKSIEDGIPVSDPLSEYGSFYFYFLCLRSLIIVGIIFMILQTALKIIRSISSLETFRMENIQSFRMMGKYFLLWFLISIPVIKQLSHTMRIGVDLDLKIAVFALVCFVLAEIFSEGNKLMEENKLTI